MSRDQSPFFMTPSLAAVNRKSETAPNSLPLAHAKESDEVWFLGSTMPNQRLHSCFTVIVFLAILALQACASTNPPDEHDDIQSFIALQDLYKAGVTCCAYWTESKHKTSRFTWFPKTEYVHGDSRLYINGGMIQTLNSTQYNPQKTSVSLLHSFLSNLHLHSLSQLHSPHFSAHFLHTHCTLPLSFLSSVLNLFT
ncbi:uncharacterized protein LOC133677578 [Populus nigra]|uniref:uncharacterized protein LOC133677578 n=1 Tax=Populus nigra TaxID=3691 RepID=UPI002B271BC7|nr:uncharacterized protein LOC133677578 [Populus nigra]